MLLACERAFAQRLARIAPEPADRVETPRPDGVFTRPRIEAIRRELLDADGSRVLVVAHRGDWRNAPENSLQAIRNCIEMGVDIVEIDVRMTRDRRLVLMHDETLDRTTTGAGGVWDATLDELRGLRLKNGQGIPTNHRIPTLEEAMHLARGRIMVNLDKCYSLYAEAHATLAETGTLDHAIVKGWQTPPGEFQRRYGALAQDVVFMPIIDLDRPEGHELLAEWRCEQEPPVAYELIFAREPPGIATLCRELRREGSRVWLNALWPFFNASHDDERAVDDPDGSYGWLVATGANILQTDRPKLLSDYLASTTRDSKLSTARRDHAPARCIVVP